MISSMLKPSARFGRWQQLIVCTPEAERSSMGVVVVLVGALVGALVNVVVDTSSVGIANSLHLPSLLHCLIAAN